MAKNTAPIDPMNVPGGVMARLLGMASGTLTRHVGEGRISQNSNGRYNLEETIAQYIRYATGKSDAIPQGRSNLLKQQERKLKLSNDKESGRLIETAVASGLFTEYMSRLRSGIAALPGRNASTLSGMSSAKKIRALLSEEVNTLLAHAEAAIPVLGRIDRQTAGDATAGAIDSEASAEQDTERVGRRKQNTAKRQRRAG